MSTIPKTAETLEQRFERLSERWEIEDVYMSGPRSTHLPAFREIVSMGEAVIPFVLRKMESEGGNWDLAMGEITGKKPFPPSAAGKIRLMQHAWFDWARKNGYMW